MMQPGFITTISEPYTPNLTDYLSQVDADDPEVWFKFQSTTTMLNDGSKGATFDGAYSDPPVTLDTGPLTTDEATTKALRVVEATTSTPVVTATTPTTASFNDRGLYAVGTNYSTDDVVYDTSTVRAAKWYRAITSSTGQALTNATYWEELLPNSATYPASLPTREPWTIELWMKMDITLTSPGGEVWPALVGFNQSGSKRWEFGWETSSGGGTGRFLFSYSGFKTIQEEAVTNGGSTVLIDPEEWHHFAITNTGSSSATDGGTMRLFIDGEIKDENATASWTRHYPGVVGDIELRSERHTPLVGIGGTQYSPNFNIDQLCFYSRELSEDRIRKHYEAAP